jgi:hypothetical protein
VVLSARAASAKAKEILKVREGEMPRLERIHRYLRDDPNRRLEGLPPGAPSEIHRLARVSRVNMLKFVVNSRVQAMYVDGFRAPRAAEDVAPFKAWQSNKMDARQIGIHRGALGAGAAYSVVLPGDTGPVIRGVSARRMTAVYGDDDEWPEFALEKRRNGGWRLLDDEAVYNLSRSGEQMEFVDHKLHDARVGGEKVTPVIRYRETDDLDDEVTGLVEPLIPLQDQINITTFGLQVAQHYGAFRQRFIIGWMAETEYSRLKASASKLLTFEDSPDDIKVGEFDQTDLKGYLESREATLQHLATVSQTPAHELLGQLANLSAEALVAAEAGYRRAVAENQTVIGEAHEQTLQLAGAYMGVDVDDAAQVRWRDTEARSLAATVDALGKLTQMLGVPPSELWELIPGVSQQQVERWKKAVEEAAPLRGFEELLERQAAGAGRVGADA